MEQYGLALKRVTTDQRLQNLLTVNPEKHRPLRREDKR